MDSGIVEEFQNLHVLPDSEVVDSVAIVVDELSPRLHRKAHGRHGDIAMGTSCTIRHPIKKRRCKKRKSAMIIGPVVGANVSEGLDGGSTSESGGGGTLTRQMFMDCVSRLSDSDSVTVGHQSTAVPGVAMATNTLVESDSVTENWSPLRPQRRRRHLRRMAVDDLCDQPHLSRCRVPGELTTSRYAMQTSANRTIENADLSAGKRKRGAKDKSDNSSFDCDFIHEDLAQKSVDCVKMQESGASSSISSDESELGTNSNEDAADGDDEQSDFYVESEPRQTVHRTSSRDSDSEFTGVPVDFDSLLSGNWDLMSPASQSHLKARFKLFSGRQFQAGRRRITDRTRPPYLYSCFLQDRQRWNQTTSSWCPCPSTAWYQSNVNPCTSAACADGGGGGKRHRLMATSEQPVEQTCDGVVHTEGGTKLLPSPWPSLASPSVPLSDSSLRLTRRKIV